MSSFPPTQQFINVIITGDHWALYKIKWEVRGEHETYQTVPENSAVYTAVK